MPAMHPDVANGVGSVADHREFRTTAAPRQASAPLLAVRLTTPEGPFPMIIPEAPARAHDAGTHPIAAVNSQKKGWTRTGMPNSENRKS